ncbi:antibiotic biosynthesis monooxygenase family protein [Ornithinibacillus halophilus]|uniref:Heme-degrading monooxygenase HmoA n=1 Tax=Ornithinibacillus halophilus TaxID=930117 RepID=A0A1M5M836_9BACI|nr:antibiotic biosynthesis monooxygenase [Ornithinibacillus halophilus]SHG73422.1 Heme-degrading monooxygenase HmoA [Ornithinibacillus halophilus]
MNAYMTHGTVDFLTTLKDKHPSIDFFFMTSGAKGLTYYEGTGKSIFVAGRTYEILLQNGAIQKEGFVVMNNIPVTDDGRPVFEDRFKQRGKEVDKMPGFQAFRLLKPDNGNTYVVFTQWKSESDFDNWKNSANFQKAHKDSGTKPPAYFADRPFVTTYHMMREDET